MSMEYRCSFDWRVRKALIDGIGRICRILFDEGLIKRLVSVEPPYRVDVGGCVFKVFEKSLVLEDYDVDVIALYDSELKFEGRKNVDLWYYRLDYCLRVKRNNIEDLKLTEKAFREVSKVAIEILEGKPIGEIGECKVQRASIEGEVKGEITVGFEFYRPFLNGFGNLTVKSSKVDLVASVRCRRLSINEYTEWLERSKVLKCTFNPKVRFELARHAKRMCELMSNPKIIRWLGELEPTPDNILPLDYRDALLHGSHQIVLDRRYIFYKTIYEDYEAVYERRRFKVDMGDHTETWRFRIELSLKYKDLYDDLKKLKVSEKNIKDKIRKIMKAIGDFTSDILGGKQLDKIGVIREYKWRGPYRKFRYGEVTAAIPMFTDHVGVWKVYDDFVLEARISKDFLWRGEGELEIFYPSWQEELKAKGKIKSREDILRIVKLGVYYYDSLHYFLHDRYYASLWIDMEGCKVRRMKRKRKMK